MKKQNMLRRNIFAICKEKKIKISDLANELGIDISTIYRWDICSPRVSTFLKVAQILDVSPTRLLNDKPNDD